MGFSKISNILFLKKNFFVGAKNLNYYRAFSWYLFIFSLYVFFLEYYIKEVNFLVNFFISSKIKLTYIYVNFKISNMI